MGRFLIRLPSAWILSELTKSEIFLPFLKRAKKTENAVIKLQIRLAMSKSCDTERVIMIGFLLFIRQSAPLYQGWGASYFYYSRKKKKIKFFFKKLWKNIDKSKTIEYNISIKVTKRIQLNITNVYYCRLDNPPGLKNSPLRLVT